MAQLFNSADIKIGHEMYFGMPNSGMFIDQATGDSSWLAVPYLEKIKETGTTIIQITRNPVRVINSQFCSKFFSRTKITEGMLWDMYPMLVLPELRKFKGLDRLMYFWIKWNEKIEPYADHRFKIEDINENTKLPFEKLGINIHNKKLLPPIPTNRRTKQQYIKLGTLSRYPLYENFIKKAKEYGYNLKE